MIRAEIGNTTLRLFSSFEEACRTGELIKRDGNYNIRYWEGGYFVETNRGFYDCNGYFEKYLSDDNLLYLSRHSEPVQKTSGEVQ